MRAALLALPLALLAACSRGDPGAKHRLFARDQGPAAAQAFDPAHPEAALSLTADEVAARLGSFEWAGAVEWSAERTGGAAVHVTEQHRVRQAATGEFEVRADVDPGQGPSAVQGKQVLWVNGMTYARALPAPFRERPTDHGRDARRFREDSFGLVRSVAEAIPGLLLKADGSGTVLGREALRFRFALGEVPARKAAAAPPGYQAKDPDTAARQGFLAGAVASSVDGELAVDARTGAPLQVRLSARLDGPGADGGPGPAVTVAVSGQVKALGGEVAAVAAPAGALPDERKPAGPSTALEAAGLKKHGEDGQAAEPADDAE